jgi:hypothetical protein
MSFPRRAPERTPDAGGPLPLRVPQDRAAAGRKRLGLARDAIHGDLPVAAGQAPNGWSRTPSPALVRAGPGPAPHGVDVVCPGFTGDCLETLEEINDGRQAPCVPGSAERQGLPLHRLPERAARRGSTRWQTSARRNSAAGQHSLLRLASWLHHARAALALGAAD